MAPQLLARVGIGIQVAGQLLVTAGDNPDRLRSEASFAMLCGVAPLPASSGLTRRHRLNRGGDRQANSALHLAVISRIRVDEKTQAYMAKKTAEGHSNLEIIRCLKRYLGPRGLLPVERADPHTHQDHLTSHPTVPPSLPNPPARRHGQPACPT